MNIQVSNKWAVTLLFLFLFTACNPFTRSWDNIYKEQQEFFNKNKRSFALTAAILDTLIIIDTTVSISNSILQLPDNLVNQLKNAGISQVTIRRQNCISKDLRFLPDSLWYHEKFSVLEIVYNKCDERSRQGFHWTMKGSDHKHSFGQGDGWFIYSDSDPF